MGQLFCNVCKKKLRLWNKKIVYKNSIICSKCAYDLKDEYGSQSISKNSYELSLSMFFWKIPPPPVNGFSAALNIGKSLLDGDYSRAIRNMDDYHDSGQSSQKIIPAFNIFNDIPCVRCNTPVNEDEYIEISSSSPRINAQGEKFFLYVPFCSKCQSNILYTTNGKEFRFDLKDYVQFSQGKGFSLTIFLSRPDFIKQIAYTCKNFAADLFHLLSQRPDIFFLFVDREKANHPLHYTMYRNHYNSTLNNLKLMSEATRPSIAVMQKAKSSSREPQRIDFNNKSTEQIFISYKSENVVVARRIAEILMQNGFKVWFNEYKILIDDYNNFSKSIQAGINSSIKAICLTNNLYADSPHCRDEIVPLLNKLGAQKIFELKIPKEDKTWQEYPELKHSPGYTWNNSYTEFFKTLKNKGFIKEMPIIKHQGTYHNGAEWMRLKERNIYFDISGWEKINIPDFARQGTEFSDTSNQRAYIRKINGKTLNVHLLFQRFKAGKAAEFIRDENINDREVFKRNLFGTKEYMEMSGDVHGSSIEILGIHLFFLFGYSHYAFTYKMKQFMGMKTNTILRKYTICLPIPETKEELEIVITAGVKEFTSDGSLENFLKYTPIFDEFVMTAEKD